MVLRSDLLKASMHKYPDTRPDNAGFALCGKKIGDVLFVEHPGTEGCTRQVVYNQSHFSSLDHAFHVQQYRGDKVCDDCTKCVTDTFWGVPDEN